MRDVLPEGIKSSTHYRTIGARPVPFENFFKLDKKKSDNTKKRI